MTKTLITRRSFNTALAAGATLTFLPGTGRAAVKITAAEAVETMYYLPLYVAKAKGFFEEEGLDVEIFNAQQRTIALRAIVAGDAFTYNGDPAEPALGRMRGAACKNIGVLVNRAVQVVLAEKGMSKDPKDWKGEKIIIPRPPHTAVSLIQMLLIDNGYTKADADGLVWKPASGESIHLLPVIAGSELNALMAGQAKLSLTNEPSTSIGVSKGYAAVASFSEHFGPFFFTSFAVMEDSIKSKKKEVQAFVNAITKAMVYGHKYPGQGRRRGGRTLQQGGPQGYPRRRHAHRRRRLLSRRTWSSPWTPTRTTSTSSCRRPAIRRPATSSTNSWI